MLGSFAVGKTSLVRRFVTGNFSDKYLSTIGVRIDKKIVERQDRLVKLILWDIHGDDEFQRVPDNYLRGSAGYFLVLDGTRKKTVDDAFLLQKRITPLVESVPFIVLLNKSDLQDEWEISEDLLRDFDAKGAGLIKTSAKTGEGVEFAFEQMAGLVTLEKT